MPTTKEYIRTRGDLGIEQVEEDLVILDKRHQKVHQLNATACAIWSSISEQRNRDEVIRDFVEKFDVSTDIAQQDVSRTLDEFRKLKLLEDQIEH